LRFRLKCATPLNEGNLHYAKKFIDLQVGDETTLNFGDEIGYTLSGLITINKKPIEKANCGIRLADKSIKSGWTDSNGRFQIHGIAPGRHELWADTHYWFSHDDPDRERQPPKVRHKHHPITIDNDMAIHIDFGDESGDWQKVDISIERMENEKTMDQESARVEEERIQIQHYTQENPRAMVEKFLVGASL